MVLQAPRQALTAGFVFCGGHSRRMGHDKALLPFGATDLLGHAVERLRAAGAGRVALLCGAEPRHAHRGWPLVPDAVADAGPAGGLLAALRTLAAGERALVLAVDVPHVPAPLLHALATLDADAVVPEGAAGPEPLVACYDAACAGPLAECLARGEARMTAFWPAVRVVCPGPAWLESFGDPARMFANWNQPADLGRG
ncbi:MAG: molybdenum cofactor guanylyltransferase [Vicinamibacteria bacterium]|nr:molybdenum cofactor guanylyltransferase [Vicinamibacteria bacterium]